jgi:hypothetical protein
MILTVGSVDGTVCFSGNLWVFGIGDRGGKRYSTRPSTRINWDAEPSGYAENPNNWIFLNKLLWQFEVLLLLFTVYICV